MLRTPTALVFDADAPVHDEFGALVDVGRLVTVRAAGPVYDALEAGRDALPDLPADLCALFV